MRPDSYRTRSPDAIDVYGEQDSNINVNKITMPSTRDLVFGTLLSFSILVNIWLIYQYRDFRTEEWLKNNDLTFFKTNEYADLKAKVIGQEALINAYGLKQACEKPR